MPKFASLAVAVCICAGLACVLWGAPAWGADSGVGGPELQLLKDIITGSLGKAIALVVALVGVYTAVRGSVVPGIIMVLLAVAFIMMPKIYNGLNIMFCPVADQLGGYCSSTRL